VCVRIHTYIPTYTPTRLKNREDTDNTPTFFSVKNNSAHQATSGIVTGALLPQGTDCDKARDFCDIVADHLLQMKVVIDAQASELASRGKKMQEIAILIECAICMETLSKDTVCNINQILCFAARLVQQALTILVSRAALQSPSRDFTGQAL